MQDAQTLLPPAMATCVPLQPTPGLQGLAGPIRPSPPVGHKGHTPSPQPAPYRVRRAHKAQQRSRREENHQEDQDSVSMGTRIDTGLYRLVTPFALSIAEAAKGTQAPCRPRGRLLASSRALTMPAMLSWPLLKPKVTFQSAFIKPPSSTSSLIN